MNASLYQRIAASTAHRESRIWNASQILENVEELPDLVALASLLSDKNHHKAMWILEIVAANNIHAFKPFIDQFCNMLPRWKNDAAQRSAAKIAMLLIAEHSKSTIFTDEQLQNVATQCFDWLIGTSKVAVKAYSIYALFDAGKIQQWIYPELREILIKEYGNQSPAYKAASRSVLRRLA